MQVSVGHLSGKSTQTLMAGGAPVRLLQTDTAINPGNSGGPIASAILLAFVGTTACKGVCGRSWMNLLACGREPASAVLSILGRIKPVRCSKRVATEVPFIPIRFIAHRILA